jgi:predicted ATPase
MRRVYVITGGPCVGKTTLINALAADGFPVLHEVARKIIDAETLKGSNILPWSDKIGFQRRVFESQLEQERKLSGGIIFLDRGLHDGFAYYKLYGWTIPPEFIQIAKTHRYSGVFQLDRSAEYQQDTRRREDYKTAKQIDLLLEDTYTEFNHKPLKIPFFSVDERKKIVLGKL